jgi:DNA-directed RNA polymerase specialized sigma24 family protein
MLFESRDAGRQPVRGGPSSARSAEPPCLEPLASLLAILDPDRERAAEKYEAIRRGLRGFFAWRGSVFPDELADETIDRVQRRLAGGATIRVQDPSLYFYGVARNVLRESWARGRSAHQVRATWALLQRSASGASSDPGPDEADRRLDCLGRCLECLPPEARAALLRYYEDQGAKADSRRRLAQSLGVAVPALRVRMHRLRLGLERCLQGCLERSKA